MGRPRHGPDSAVMPRSGCVAITTIHSKPLEDSAAPEPSIQITCFPSGFPAGCGLQGGGVGWGAGDTISQQAAFYTALSHQRGWVDATVLCPEGKGGTGAQSSKARTRDQGQLASSSLGQAAGMQ